MTDRGVNTKINNHHPTSHVSSFIFYLYKSLLLLNYKSHQSFFYSTKEREREFNSGTAAINPIYGKEMRKRESEIIKIKKKEEREKKYGGVEPKLRKANTPIRIYDIEFGPQKQNVRTFLSLCGRRSFSYEWQC